MILSNHGIIQSINRGGGIVTNGLVLHLDAGNAASYPGSGTTWTDLSGNGYNGTLVNGPTYDSANGGSIVFDGSNDYVDLGTSIPDFTTAMTISFWAKISGTPFDGIVITKGSFYSASNYGFQIGFSNGFVFYTFQGGYQTISTSNIWNNNIANFVLTFDNGTINYYKNNSLFSTHSFSLSTLPSASSAPTNIGFLSGYNAYYVGNIYQMATYNRVLTASEIEANYNTLKNRYGL
jgi:hypothetical protein